jgi:hypothetical protein
MSVDYRIEHRTTSRDGFSNLLRESHDYFKQTEKVSILGEGIKDIFSDSALFNDYVEKLSEGASATEAEELRLLMENARVNTFLESSVSGIQPVASLTMPIIRKLWARTGLVKVIPTEVVQQNAFSISFNLPYIIDEEGEKHYLPEALDNEKSAVGNPRKSLTTEVLELPLDEHDLLGEVGCSKKTGDTVDINFAVSTVILGEEGVEVAIPRKKGLLDTNGKIYLDVKGEDAEGNELTDTVFVFVDCSNGVINATSLKNVAKGIKIKGYVASDAHNRATNVSFEIKKRECTIGTGEHFEASLPLEFLQDAMAMYKIDGTTEVVDVLSNVVAQKLDIEIDDFITDVIESTNEKYYGEFDLRPSASYAGPPKDWREELKTVIDWVATDLRSTSHAYQGYFAIIGNPLDTMLIPNVSWSFNHSTDTVAGIQADYSIGAMSGENQYSIVSSDLVARGTLKILFCPTTDKFMSVKYYPYTYNVVNNYLNTQKSNVPNIMVTKRHTIEDFLPLVASIKIVGNTGKLLSELPR